jgi:hypothetical protein
MRKHPPACRLKWNRNKRQTRCPSHTRGGSRPSARRSWVEPKGLPPHSVGWVHARRLDVFVLCLLLAASAYVVYEGWTAHSGGIELPDWGLALLGVGAMFGLVIGCGLMALAFYSSRRGYDERTAVGKQDERDADDRR